MMDKEATKDYGALRKHREKRRAKGAVGKLHDDGEESNNDKNSLTASTEASLGDFVEFSPRVSEKQEMVSTIIATTADREKMRKISILGLEDPADGVSQRRREKHIESGVIVTTESSLEQMRKISKLGLEDPADYIMESKHGKRGRRKDPDSKPSSDGRTKHRLSQEYRERHHAHDKEDNQGESPCAMLDVLFEKQPKSPRPRSRSIDNEMILMERDHVPIKKDKKPPRTRSYDLDQCFVPDEGIECAPPVQVKVPKQEFTKSRTCGPKDFAGIIEATKEQQQLMRKVSALGMYDPVFGNVHKDMEISHASIVFEDMDLNDVPEDMRDLLGHTSEHTDPVFRASTASPDCEDSSSDEVVYEKSFVPPMGSFALRGSKRNITVDGPATSTKVAPSPGQPKVTKSLRALPTHRGKKDHTRGSQESFPQHVSDAYHFIPPTGSFNVRKPRKRSSTPTRVSLLKDIELAARAQSMFARDSLLGMSASNLESNLHASLGSFHFDMSVASPDHSGDNSHNSDKSPKEVFAPPTLLLNDRGKSPSDRHLYVPPSLLSQSRERGRTNRDMTDSRLSQSQEITLSPNDILRKQTLSSPRKHLAKQHSSRSWDGDNNLEDPMAAANQMWASLSVLNTDFATIEDT